jgi:hypothetical protein
MACNLEFDASHRVIRARFDGTLTRGDLESMIVRAGAFVARYEGFHGIIDFTDVVAVSVDDAYLRELGRGRRIKGLLGFRRILVAPSEEGQRLAHFYGEVQVRTGHSVEIVHTMAEAFERLGIKTPDFRPLGEAVASKAPSKAAS